MTYKKRKSNVKERQWFRVDVTVHAGQQPVSLVEVRDDWISLKDGILTVGSTRVVAIFRTWEYYLAQPIETPHENG